MKTRHLWSAPRPGSLLCFFLFACHCLLPPPMITGQIAEWTFENITSAVPSLPIAASMKDPRVNAWAYLSGGNNNGSPAACSGNETWSTNFWPTSGNRSTGDYIEFEVRTDPGETAEVTYFSFSSSASSTNSALDFDVYFSQNNFVTATFLFSGSHSLGSCSFQGSGLNAVILPGAFLQFRIYPYGQSAAAQAASIRLDNVSIDGLVLPVTLADLSVRKQSEGVLLEWTTAAEINNDHFAIDHSTDGLSFVEIAQIPGAGNSVTPQYYRYIHRQPATGENYYRLRQVDMDGRQALHPVLAIYIDPAALLQRPIRVFPTVAEAAIRIHLGFRPDHPLPYAVYSSDGRPAMTGVISPQGAHEEISVRHLPAGSYILSLSHQGRRYPVRFIRQ